MKSSEKSQGGISLARIAKLRTAEADVFRRARPKSEAAVGKGIAGFFGGVPMHWMNDWPTPFPIVVDRARGATILDIDGIRLDDFCLGDTGSMFGHSPPPVARAIRRQAGRGLTYMLPDEDALVLGRLLSERSACPNGRSRPPRPTPIVSRCASPAPSPAGRKSWSSTAAITARSTRRWCGWSNGTPVNRPGLAGEFRDLTEQTKVVEFNDIPALEKALAAQDVACVITEPVLTNCCMVLPEPGFHDALRKLTRKTGTLLLIDETHTISTGPGGYTQRFGLEPDLFVLGKPIAGGVPASVWGMSAKLAKRYRAYNAKKEPGYSGMGTTLSANPLQFAAMRATLEEVMTETNYAHMERLARRLDAGLTAVIDRFGLPWHVMRVGARVEFICAPGPLRNGGEAEAAHAPALEAAIHVALVNRGVLIAPFHNMMLISPATTAGQVNRLITAFAEVAGLLAA